MKRVIVVLAAVSILTLFDAGFSAEAAGGYKVIVNQNVPLSQLSKSEVQKIMMKKTSKFSDGTRASPVDLQPDSSVREAFSKDVLGRSTSGVKNFWQRQIFSGKNVPPPEVSSDAEVIAYVGSNSGGLGYVSEGARLNGSVKPVDLVE